VQAEQAGQGPQGRGLAGAVGAEEGDDGAVGHREADPLEDQQDVVVDDFQVLDGEHRRIGLPLVSWIGK
jgi:hypothetical protein